MNYNNYGPILLRLLQYVKMENPINFILEHETNDKDLIPYILEEKYRNLGGDKELTNLFQSYGLEGEVLTKAKLTLVEQLDSHYLYYQGHYYLDRNQLFFTLRHLDYIVSKIAPFLPPGKEEEFLSYLNSYLNRRGIHIEEVDEYII